MPGTVTVGCKIPNGLILRVFDFETMTVPVMAGGVKEMKIAKPRSWYHKINGPARKIGQDIAYQITAGAGLTHGVDADMFALWLEQNKDEPYVTRGLVFGGAKQDATIAQAHEHRNEKSGMEPVDPKNLPPEFRASIQTATTVA